LLDDGEQRPPNLGSTQKPRDAAHEGNGGRDGIDHDAVHKATFRPFIRQGALADDARSLGGFRSRVRYSFIRINTLDICRLYEERDKKEGKKKGEGKRARSSRHP
jgi:hypothetical protein